MFVCIYLCILICLCILSSSWTCYQPDSICSEPHICCGYLVLATSHQWTHHKVCCQGKTRSYRADSPHTGGQRGGHHVCSTASLQCTAWYPYHLCSVMAYNCKIGASLAICTTYGNKCFCHMLFPSVFGDSVCLGRSWYLVQSNSQSFGDYGFISIHHPLCHTICSFLECAHIYRGWSATTLHRLSIRSVCFHIWWRRTNSLHYGSHARIRFENKKLKTAFVLYISWMNYWVQYRIRTPN